MKKSFVKYHVEFIYAQENFMNHVITIVIVFKVCKVIAFFLSPGTWLG